MTKKTIYILLFIILGIIVSSLLHAFIEIGVLKLMIKDFNNFGLSWFAWEAVHAIGSVLLLILGILLGFQQGKYWWEVVYVKGKYGKVNE